jgi:hypothetical protein
MCVVQVQLLRLGEQGHQGVDTAMTALYDQFDDDRGDQRGRDTASEFSDAQWTATSKILANPTAEDDRGCCAPVVEVKDLDHWLGEQGSTTDLAGWLGVRS